MKVSYTEEAIADIFEAVSYLNQRNPTAAANLDAEIAQCIERLTPFSWSEMLSRSGHLPQSVCQAGSERDERHVPQKTPLRQFLRQDVDVFINELFLSFVVRRLLERCLDGCQLHLCGAR